MPLSLPPGLTLRPARAADLSDIAALAIDLFSNSDHIRLFSPGAAQYPQEFYRATLHAYKARYYDPVTQVDVVENAEKEVVACTIWKAEGNSKLQEEITREKRERLGVCGTLETWLLKAEEKYLRYGILHCRDWDAVEQAHKQAEQIWKNVEEPRLHLDILLVRRDYQGKGLGKQLLYWGLDRAKEEAMPVILESTAEGRPLYEKQGFKTIGNLKAEGKDIRIPAMVWTPLD